MKMSVLRIVRRAAALFECNFEGWPTNGEKKRWQRLVARAVERAFDSRSVTLITITPMDWPLGHLLQNPHSCRTAHNGFLLNDIESCARDVLSEIADSEDFQRGLLWIAARAAGREKELVALADRFDCTSGRPPTPPFELLLLLDDARHLLWRQPGRDADALTDEFGSMAEEYGWQVHVQIEGSQ